jgi:hypothetical protein
MSAWLDQIFDADISTKEGGIIRRKKTDARKFSNLDELLVQVRERGFHLIETPNQYV